MALAVPTVTKNPCLDLPSEAHRFDKTSGETPLADCVEVISDMLASGGVARQTAAWPAGPLNPPNTNLRWEEKIKPTSLHLRPARAGRLSFAARWKLVPVAFSLASALLYSLSIGVARADYAFKHSYALVVGIDDYKSPDRYTHLNRCRGIRQLYILTRI